MKKKTQVKQMDNTQPAKASRIPGQLLKIQKKGCRAMTAEDSFLPEDISSSDDAFTEKSTFISNSREKKSESRKESSRGMISLSREDLKRAVAMSVVLGPPVSRRRKGYEGYTGRR